MADAPPSPAVPAQLQAQPDPTPVPAPPQQQTPIPLPVQNPNPMQPPAAPIPVFPGAPPSYRPVPQFSPLSNYQAPPPGVAPAMQYQVPVPGQPPNPALRPSFSPLFAAPQGTVAPPGVARFPSPYPPMVRPLYPMRPPGVLPVVSRPPMPGMIGIRPIMPPIIRPTVPSVTPAEKPQTTVYVGKIAPSVEDEFIHSLLLLCGPIKGWKRGQNPSGTPVGFGFCEFESAEGVLRALRLLSKLNIDGQELLLNVNEATKKYLERYVEKKTENSRNLKESQVAGGEKDDESAPTDDQNQSVNSSAEHLKNESNKKENHDLASFGIVTDEDREGDQDAVNKITSAIEERLKTRPLPPPPPPLADESGNQIWELQAKAKDGDAAEDDAAESKNNDDTMSENKATSEQDRPDTSSPDRSRKSDRSRERERDREREHEREVDRYEREAERERVRKERELRRKIEDAERAYEERLKDWEYREREKEKQRQYEKEKEKEKERKRRKEIQYDEDDEEDDRKRWRRSVLEERRKKRLQEKKEDLADRKREEEEIVEAQKRAEEEKQQLLRDASMLSIANMTNGGEETVVPKEGSVQSKDEVVEQAYRIDSGYESQEGDAIIQNGSDDELAIQSVSESDNQQLGAAPAKKLGFGLVGSGKRAAVPSVFNEEDEDAHKDKKMRPLVPIDYSTEELQATQPTASGATPPNLAAAAEYAKRISNVAPKEERSDAERERSRRNHDRSSQRERDHEDSGRLRDDNREKVLHRDRDRGNGVDRVKMPDKQKLLDAKQLIDMIPKTKEELFSYEINWSVYDKHQLHERMRPWISKKITEFLGEEEATLVAYIVSSTREHVQASQMLEMLQSILDDEAEMFVLKMWRMLIFEIKKVETGLAVRSKT